VRICRRDCPAQDSGGLASLPNDRARFAAMLGRQLGGVLELLCHRNQ
jgi:hypothetical protein